MQHLMLLIEQSPRGVIISRDRRMTYVNPTACRLLGYDDPGELVGRSVADLVAGPGKAQALQDEQDLLDGLTVRPQRQITGLRRDGTTFDAEYDAQRIDVDGDTMLVAFFSDVSMRNQIRREVEASRVNLEQLVRERTLELELANRKLQEKVEEHEQARKMADTLQQFQQSVLDAMTPHVAVLDEDGTILMVNEAWRQFGATNGLKMPNDGIGSNYLAACNAADDSVRQARQGLTDVLAGRRHDFYFEYPCVTPRDALWFMLRATATYRNGDRRVVVTHMDVTTIKAAQLAIAESESRFRTMADHAPCLIWTSGPDGRCNYVNQTTIAFCGVKAGDLTGVNWQDGVHPEDRDRVIARYGQIDVDHMPARIEYRYRRHDGVYRWLLDHATPRFNPDGSYAGSVGAMVDITEFKEAEQLKDEFISVANHELRTPLTAICGYAELLLNKSTTPQQQHLFLEYIRDEGVRLNEMINDMLDVRRMESGVMDYKFTSVDLFDIAREVLSTQVCPREKHYAGTSFHGGSPMVHADPMRLRQILNNLVSNAIKYSPNGGRIVIGARRHHDHVVVWVGDEGLGIPPEAMPHLFSRFFRVTEGEHAKIPGTGLGLPIVKQLVEAHGGRVHIKSRSRVGTTVYFTLPLAHDDSPLPAASCEMMFDACV